MVQGVRRDVTQILVINGPNLNALGQREPELYGHETLADIEALCVEAGNSLGLEVECFQSNSEGAMIDRIHAAREESAGIVINAGAYTHTSVALLDALRAVDLPTIEIHLSNVYQREEFRHNSFISKAALGVIVGLGSHGYILGLHALNYHLNRPT